MQIKVFSIPLVGGEAVEAELNRFLRGHKVVRVGKELAQDEGRAYWTFCVEYVSSGSGSAGVSRRGNKIDYREVLDEKTFARFSELRTIRKQAAEADGVPVYAVMTNEQLATLAAQAEITASSMASVEGIGEKKIAKFGKYFIKPESDEKGQ